MQCTSPTYSECQDSKPANWLYGVAMNLYAFVQGKPSFGSTVDPCYFIGSNPT